MNVELTDHEREVLLEILDERIGELRQQVCHATTSGFKDQLREREKTLEAIAAKFGTAKVA